MSLKQYMSDSTDSNMLKWWAQYTESTGDMAKALKIYQKADDWFSQVNKNRMTVKLNKINIKSET